MPDIKPMGNYWDKPRKSYLPYYDLRESWKGIEIQISECDSKDDEAKWIEIHSNRLYPDPYDIKNVVARIETLEAMVEKLMEGKENE